MAAVPVSLIVVSRHRPEALARAIAGIHLLDHPQTELIVVADPATCAGLAGVAAKVVAFDTANISAARNLGLAQAAGEVVAFLDDDAVPEPSWLSRLVAPFADPRVTAAGGFVRGRNGISYQWRASLVDAAGQDHPLAVPPGVSLHPGTAMRAVKTQGTNCAFRLADLRAIGGFDPAFRFYLDEADVNLRLAARGGLTAVVPGAEVHHGFAASARRRADRVPTDLTEIGASLACFLRRHNGGLAALDAHRRDQRARALRHMVEGRIEPRDVTRLMQGFDRGVAEGLARDLPPLAPLADPGAVFAPPPGLGPRPGRVIAGRAFQAARLHAEARRAAAGGAVVTLFCLSATALYHRHWFNPQGYWVQEGGVFGRAVRSDPLLRRSTLAQRVAEQCQRLAAYRPLSGG
jgi:GT2 family glycosyltransferase